MKKIIALTVLAVAGVAFASSMSVPWFVDMPSTNTGAPALSVGTTVGLVFLHNNQTGTVTCQIAYYSQDGYPLGPAAPNNTFTIPTNSTMAFRPVSDDGVDATTNPGGQESPTGKLVPNRPKISSIPGGAKNNGSLVITWVGEATDVQGIYTQTQNVDGGATGRLVMYGTLLPPGA
jgi:hypothetical protein